MSLTTRPATAEDEDFLFTLYASTREGELALVDWGPHERQAFLRLQFAAQRQDYERRFPGADHRIVLRDGRRVGRIFVARRPEEIRLVDIALLPEHRGAGIGTWLLREVLDEAEREGLPVRHMVWKGNPAALRFYERLGFAVVEDDGMYELMERLPGRAGG